MSESPFCANFDISFSLFCRKFVQSWMRRFWEKNAEETPYGAYDGPSCRFVVKLREVIPVPRFQELKCFRTKTLDGPLCLWRSVILVVKGNEESRRRNFTSMGRRSPWRFVVTMTIRRMVRRPSKYLSEIILLLKPTKWVVTILWWQHSSRTRRCIRDP